jgi:signal transduction histidine kinase
LRSEQDARIADVLRAAISKSQRASQLDESEAAAVVGVRAQAVAEVTAMIDHELRPILGTARFRAESEVPAYESSNVRAELDRLERALDAFRKLGQAAKSPLLETFDLAQLLDDLSAEIRDSRDVTIDAVGTRPFQVIGDKDLTGFIAVNALRNAADAVCDVRGNSRRSPEIVVNWDADDREYWVAVLDTGGGLPERRERIFESGITTRKDHPGMGLAIALQAAQSLGASLELDNREREGARFLLRWPRRS